MTSRSISEQELSKIESLGQTLGYPEAIERSLGLPAQPIDKLKERAIYHYQTLHTGCSDPYLLQRSWIKAFGDLLQIDFSFPHIDNLITTKPTLE